MFTRTRIPLLVALVCWTWLAPARAENPSVTAVLTESETVVGRPVQLQIQVTGTSNPRPPGEITIDGLDIRAAGTSRQYEMRNFSVSYSFTFSYTIMPLKPGTFRIPPQRVEAGGQTLQTPELTLNVANSQGAQSSRGPRGGGGNSNAGRDVKIDPSQIGFVEMILPKQNAYIGEMIPVQVRVGLNTRAPVESLGSGVQISGQGFTTQKMTEPRQTMETVNGRTYQVFIFNTAISPVRAGQLEIGPAEINPTVRVARPGRNPAVPRDMFDDPFFNQFFNDPGLRPFDSARGETAKRRHDPGSESAASERARGILRRGRQLQPQDRGQSEESAGGRPDHGRLHDQWPRQFRPRDRAQPNE